MSILSKQMDSNERESLPFGYVRLHSDTEIPFVLIQLIHSFLNSILTWNINKKQMKSLSDAKNGDKLYSPSFTIKNMTFQCFLSVNHMNNPTETQYNKYLGFFVQYQSVNSNLSKIHIYYELYCTQLDISWKSMAELTPTTNNCGWPIHSLRFPQSGLDLHQMNDKLTFESYIEILAIEYKQTNNYNIYLEDITISDCDQCKWAIKTDGKQFFDHYVKQLKETSTNQIKRFYSKNFGSFNSQNWCLECVVNNKFDILLYLRLVGLPYCISAIKVKFILTAYMGNENEYKREYIQLFDRANNNCWGWGCDVLSVLSLNDCNLIFGVTINVLEIFEYGKKDAISPSKWLDFNLLSLQNIFD